MIKLRVSYHEPKDLELVLSLLGSRVMSHKVSREQKGKYKRAYVLFREEDGNAPAQVEPRGNREKIIIERRGNREKR